MTKKCPYCQGNEYIGDEMTGFESSEAYKKEKAKHVYYGGAWCCITDDTLEYGHPGDGYDGGSNTTRINFCPMCGRKLAHK